MADERIERGAPDMPSALDRMNRLWRAFAGKFPFGPPAEGLWHPTVDVFDRDDELVVEVELPGMKGQRMDVCVEHEHLIIEGTRSRAEGFKERESYYCERPMGRFHRVIHLPCAVDEAAIVARYQDGLLTVALPKAGRRRARKIEIS